MGPIQLKLEEGNNLYQCWDASRNFEIKDFNGNHEGLRKYVETWIQTPPKIVMFQLNRVSYDYNNSKLIKNNSRFQFDKIIYIDLYLEKNMKKAYDYNKKLEKMKDDLKMLNDTKQQYKQQDQIENDVQINLIKAFETCENVLR